jgi:hypothetical protein
LFWPYKRPAKGHTKKGGEEKKTKRLKKKQREPRLFPIEKNKQKNIE